jgi:hypothetical protein
VRTVNERPKTLFIVPTLNEWQETLLSSTAVENLLERHAEGDWRTQRFLGIHRKCEGRQGIGADHTLRRLPVGEHKFFNSAHAGAGADTLKGIADPAQGGQTVKAR